jgi:hypothetical protein
MAARNRRARMTPQMARLARHGDGPSRALAVRPRGLARRRTQLAVRRTHSYSPSIDRPNAQVQEPAMTKTFAHQAATIALAALLTSAMLLATNALAGHQYRVAASASQVVAMDVQHVTIVGHRAHA